MKPSTLLLIASLLANIALVAVLATRPSAPPTASVSRAATPVPASAADRGEAALRAALAAGRARDLEAAGIAPEVARQIEFGRTFAHLLAQMRSEKATQANTRWWRADSEHAPARERQALLRRQAIDAVVTAFGDDAGLFKPGDFGQLAFLSAEKRDALRRINQDYEEMMAKFAAGGVQLASDRERLKLLRAERERDIAALLTPEELLAFELRTSPTAALVRARYGEGIETEADYRKIYALQKVFDEKFPLEALKGPITPEAMRARAEAQRQLQDDIRAALGDTAYANLRRATDADLRTVDSLVARLNLPAGTTDRVAALRENLAAESQRINAEAALPAAQRRAQIQALDTRAKTKIQQALGAEAAEAYAQRSAWVGLLQNGLAYSTTPQPNSPPALLAGGQSVFPVMPAGVASAGAMRQTVVSTAHPAAESPGLQGDLLFGAPGGAPRENVRIMTVTTTTTESPAGPAREPASTTRPNIVPPPGSAPPPPPQ